MRGQSSDNAKANVSLVEAFPHAPALYPLFGAHLGPLPEGERKQVSSPLSTQGRHVRNFLFRLIGILEVAGGFYGVVNMARRLFPLGSTHESLLAVIGLLLYGFVLIAGVMLLEGSERGVAFSSWAQLLQLPLIATPILSYALHCGAFVNVYATLHLPVRLGLDWHFGSEGFVLAVAGPGLSRIGINLLALLSWLALRLR